MDKSGRRALADNLKAITENSKSRRGWALSRRLNAKAVERAEKDEGEKGVSLQAVDDIAQGLGLAAWQLLVPDLDLTRPPRLATDQPTPTEPALELTSALELVRAVLVRARDGDSVRASEALRVLALTPDSDRAFNSALAALSGLPGVPAITSSPATRPDWRAIAAGVAHHVEDPIRRDVIEDFLRRVDREVSREHKPSQLPDASSGKSHMADKA